jgi:hypothetical protein
MTNIDDRYVDGQKFIYFNLSNSDDQGGDVLIYVEQDDLRMCEHVFRVRPNTTYRNIRLPCSSLDDGRMSMLYGWASENRDLASAADRIPDVE